MQFPATLSTSCRTGESARSCASTSVRARMPRTRPAKVRNSRGKRKRKRTREGIGKVTKPGTESLSGKTGGTSKSSGKQKCNLFNWKLWTSLATSLATISLYKVNCETLRVLLSKSPRSGGPDWLIRRHYRTFFSLKIFSIVRQLTRLS